MNFGWDVLSGGQHGTGLKLEQRLEVPVGGLLDKHWIGNANDRVFVHSLPLAVAWHEITRVEAAGRVNAVMGCAVVYEQKCLQEMDEKASSMDRPHEQMFDFEVLGPWGADVPGLESWPRNLELTRNAAQTLVHK